MMPELEAMLRERLVDEFSNQLLTGALQVAHDESNPIRHSQLASAMRELFSYTLHKLAPDDEVIRCHWYEQEPNTVGPTRRQRAKYATQGGLSDPYVADIGLDVEDLHKEAVDAIGEMSKYTHVRPETIVEDQDQIDAFVAEAGSALINLFTSFEHCRELVIEALLEKIDDAAVDALISETITDIDELSTHHSVDEVSIDKMQIVEITHDTIKIEVSGSLGVELQWGSNSDLRRGDGATLSQYFRFTVQMQSPVDDVGDFEDVRYGVDVGSWRDGGDE